MCFTLFSLGLGLCLCRAVTLTVVALIGGVGTQSLQLRAIESIYAPLQLAFSVRTFARDQQNAIRQPAPNAGIGERQHGTQMGLLPRLK